jgi:hypothetical protein
MKRLTCIPVIVLILSISCTNKDKDQDGEPVITSIKGAVQKGPFLNGTVITVSELQDDLSQTGKTYSTEITDSRGSFQLDNISLVSKYVEISASGYYFNENEGQNSIAPLTLSAISDITDKASLNVNVLTYLEKNRVKYLVANGTSFTEAKKQAQTEILKLFEISKPEMAESELLDVTKAGDDNAVLLSVSSILQGKRTVSELSELLSNISTDIREDGELNTESLGTSLINDARLLNPDTIRYNLAEKYQELDTVVDIPDFQDYFLHFIENTSFVYTNIITYPDTGATGANVLAMDRTLYNSGETYLNSMTVVAPGWNTVSVRLTFIDTCNLVPPACDTCPPSCLPCGQSSSCSWGIDPIKSGWTVSTLSVSPMTFLMEKDFTRETCDLKMALVGHGQALIEIFENNSPSLTRSKTIRW